MGFLFTIFGGMLDGGYGIIPNVVLFSKDLNSTSKLMFCLISSLCAETGECWASNFYLGSKLSGDYIDHKDKDREPDDVDCKGSRARLASRIVSKLEAMGFIKLEFERASRWVKRIIRISSEYQNRKNPHDKNVVPGQNSRIPTTKMSYTHDKNVVDNTIIDNNTNIIDNSINTITPGGEDLVKPNEVMIWSTIVDTSPPPPTPAPQDGEIVDDTGEKKDKSNPMVNEIIEAMKDALKSKWLLYKPVNFIHTNKVTGVKTRITDRFLVSNILRTKDFKDTIEMYEMGPGEFVKNIVVYSIQSKRRNGPVNDATKLFKYRKDIYNDIITKKTTQTQTKEY